MAYYLLTGEELNLIAPAASVPVFSPAVDSLYPAAQLSDGRPYLAGRFGSVAADSTITADLNAVPWPGFEDAVAPAASFYASAWTAGGGGTLSRDTGTKNSGVAGLHVTGGAGAFGFVDILVRPGQSRKIEWAIRGPGAAAAVFFRLRNLHTGNYLQAGGASWGAISDLATTTSSVSFATGSVTYTVESLAACGGAPLVWLRIFCQEQGFYDDIYDYTAVDFCGAFGTQNWDPAIAPQFRSSTDNFSGSDVLQASPTFAKPVIASRLAAPVLHRYWRLKLVGTPRVAPGIGELVFGLTATMLKAPNLAPTVTWKEAGQIRRGALSGATRARNMGPWPTREVALSWRFETQAQFRQFRDEIFQGSRGGAIPLVLMATDATQGLDYPLFGMFSETASGRRLASSSEYWDLDGELDEQPFPNL